MSVSGPSSRSLASRIRPSSVNLPLEHTLFLSFKYRPLLVRARSTSFRRFTSFGQLGSYRSSKYIPRSIDIPSIHLSSLPCRWDLASFGEFWSSSVHGVDDFSWIPFVFGEVLVDEADGVFDVVPKRDFGSGGLTLSNEVFGRGVSFGAVVPFGSVDETGCEQDEG